MENDLSEDSSESSSDYEEECMNVDAEILCLFCEEKFTIMDHALDHCQSVHSFDINIVKDKHTLDYFGYIKLINFIRAQKAQPKELLEAELPLWDSDTYLQPTDINDSWLWYDLPGLKSPPGLEECEPKYVNSEGGKVTLSQDHFSQLQARIQSLSEQILEKDENISILRKMLKLDEEPAKNTSICNNDSGSYSNYFSSYSNAAIHQEMLSDIPRMEAYSKAITGNAPLFSGKTVLDLGCGTAILSMMSVTAGAKKVFGVDDSDILYHAIDIVRINELSEKIELIKSKIENADLPQKSFDIIVSEWMGYFLLFEGMLDSVIYARNTFLKPGGRLLPSSCDLQICGISDMDKHKKLVSFWEDVNGFKMDTMKSLSVKEPSIEIVNPESIITDCYVVKTLNIYTCDLADLDFRSEFILSPRKDCELTALVGFFNAYFDIPNAVTLSTSPLSEPTHWKQTVFYLQNPLKVYKDCEIKVLFKCGKCPTDARSLVVNIVINDIQHCYHLSG